MALVRPKAIPQNWPKWNRQCEAIRWQRGGRCKAAACLGSTKCKRHGGHGEVSGERAWKRYLLWILLPDAIRAQTMSPVLDHEVEAVCQIIAHACLVGDQHASEAARMSAATYLLASAAAATHPDPALHLTHLSREDAEAAIRILRINGLLL